MKIVCPACASQYELDAAKLGPDGRKVRCAACKTLWHVEAMPDFPEPPSPEETLALLNDELAQVSPDASDIDEPDLLAAPEIPGEVDGEPPPATPPQRKRARGRTSRSKARPSQERLGGAALPLVICGAGLLALGLATWQRDLAVRAAPQLAGVFETLGLPVNIRGLRLTAVESGVVDDGQGRFLVVEGDVTNVRRAVMPVPPIEVVVMDAAGRTLYTWTTDPPRPSLEPAELVRFRARLAQPPENGHSVQVRFGAAKTAGMAKTTGMAKATSITTGMAGIR